MNATKPQTIALNEKSIEGAIEVLSRASAAFRLTRFERRSYRTLVVSVDLFIVSTIGGLVTFFVGGGDSMIRSEQTVPSMSLYVMGVFGIVFLVSGLIGVLFLLLNTPLFLKAIRERARLEKLGLGSLSTSLWRASRRSQWFTRVRGAVLIVVGAIFLIVAILGSVTLMFRESEIETEAFKAITYFVGFYGIVAALLFGTRYLRNQRERMDLAANAEELKKVLQSLRRNAINVEAVSVPVELVEQAAIIESAQIASDRKDAILQSVTSLPSGFSVVFDREAAEQRATLVLADRIGLEDLLAQLSSGLERKHKSPMQPEAGSKAATLRSISENGRVEIEYTVDQASRSMQVIAVRCIAGDFRSASREASDA